MLKFIFCIYEYMIFFIVIFTIFLISYYGGKFNSDYFNKYFKDNIESS